MIAGTLKEIIKVLEPTTVKDDFGSTNIQYLEKIVTRASVQYKDGKREVENNEIINSYQFIFIIRSYHKVSEKMLIEWKGKKYKILSIDNTEQSKQVIISELVNE